MKLLHLIHDGKFYGFVNDVFTNLQAVENRFIGFAADYMPAGAGALSDHWRHVGLDYFDSPGAAADLAWCDCLIVHFLNPQGAQMMLRAPARVTTMWSGWGGDYLSLVPDADSSLLTPETAALLKEIRRKQPPRRLREIARQYAERLLWRFRYQPMVRAAALRADFFSAPLKQDFEVLKSALGPRFRPRYAQLDYQSMEYTSAPGPAGLTGNDILLGNSATPTNNHVDVLYRLARTDLGGRRVVAPLSYGDPAYRDAILELGKQLLGARFEPLTAFLPLAEYNAQIARCAVVIMNHRRQQGLGNIASTLVRGARVYLNDAGAAFRYLTELGLHVAGTREIGKAGWLDPPTPAQLAQNRAGLASIWSRETVMRNAAAFVAAASGQP